MSTGTPVTARRTSVMDEKKLCYICQCPVQAIPVKDVLTGKVCNISRIRFGDDEEPYHLCEKCMKTVLLAGMVGYGFQRCGHGFQPVEQNEEVK